MQKFIKQVSPVVIPTQDGKHIAEHYGSVSTGNDDFSFAHMVAPPQWSEPPQRPQFDEVTFVIRGRKRVVVDGEEITITTGESLLVKKGATVTYSNPFDEEVEYISFCLPAFTSARVHREDS